MKLSPRQKKAYQDKCSVFQPGKLILNQKTYAGLETPTKPSHENVSCLFRIKSQMPHQNEIGTIPSTYAEWRLPAEVRIGLKGVLLLITKGHPYQGSRWRIIERPKIFLDCNHRATNYQKIMTKLEVSTTQGNECY